MFLGLSGSNLVLALGDTILLRDFATGTQQGETIHTSGRVKRLWVFKQKLFLVVDHEGQIWDLPTRRMIGKGLLIGNPGTYLSIPVDVSADGHRVLMSSNGGYLELWDVPTAKRLLILDADEKTREVAMDPSGMSLTYLSEDHTLNRWGPSRSVTDHSWLDADGVSALIGEPRTLRYALRFSDRGQTKLELFDNETMSLVGPPLPLNAPARVGLCSPRNDLILIGCEDGSAQLWSPITLAPVGLVMRHPQAVTSAAFTLDGRIIATGSGRTARLWDVYLCRPIGPLMEQPAEIKDVYFSADGRWLLVKCDEKGCYRWPVPAPMEGDADRVLDRVKEWTR